MDETFQIGDFCFQILFSKDIHIPDNFMKFQSKIDHIDYTYYIEVNEQFPLPDGKQIAVREDLMVYQNDSLEMRYIGVKGADGYYACYQEIDNKHACIYLHPDKLKGLNIDPVFSSLLALEKRMVYFHEIILHCAYIRYQNQAILFTAPSGTGKSTQADLWQKYLHSKTINGDRSLLGKKNDQWIAQGWPVCGSSEICHNMKTPIRAIVVLSQEKNNDVEKLSPAKAFPHIYSQITINKWNQKNHLHIIDLIEDLIYKVPVYHLGCTISKEAVDCLYEMIYK